MRLPGRPRSRLLGRRVTQLRPVAPAVGGTPRPGGTVASPLLGKVSVPSYVRSPTVTPTDTLVHAHI